MIYPQKKGNLPLPKSKPEQIHTENIGIFKTLRDYQTTDLASRIDWRSSMKHQNLLVRSFEPQGPQIISIDWIDLDPSMPFEEKICQLAKWIYQLSNDGAEYSFCVGTRIFGPGKGPAHMHACLEFLSLLESDLDIGHLNV